MQKLTCIPMLIALSVALSGQVSPRPVVSTKTVIEGRPCASHLDPQVTTTIRLPEPVNSVVIGDSTLFHAEYSPSSQPPYSPDPFRQHLRRAICHFHDAWTAVRPHPQ